jgi:hypothetical protein
MATLKKIYTMKEFEKKYRPENYKRNIFKALTDPKKIGKELARRSLRNISCKSG